MRGILFKLLDSYFAMEQLVILHRAYKIFHGSRGRRIKRQLELLYTQYRRSKLRNQLLIFLFSAKLYERRYWMMIYNQNWFSHVWHLRNNEIITELFKKEFRVFPRTFEEIVGTQFFGFPCWLNTRQVSWYVTIFVTLL